MLHALLSKVFHIPHLLRSVLLILVAGFPCPPAFGTDAPTTAVGPNRPSFQPASFEYRLNLKGSAEQLHSTSDSASHSYSLLFGGVDGGLFFSHFISFHGEAKAYRQIDQGAAEGRSTRQYHHVESVAVQLGNPAYHHVRAVAGKGDLPFGIGHRPLMESITMLLSSRATPPKLLFANFILDDLISSKLEMGLGTPKDPRERQEIAASGHQGQADNDTAFFRYSEDFPELYATRASFSARGTRGGGRVIGLGLINQSSATDTTAFEFSKGRSTPNPSEDADIISIRASYLGAFVQGARVGVLIEDLSNLYRIGVIQGDWKLASHALARLGVGYLKAESEIERTRWFISGGLEAAL